jgi:hypothetical protein
MNEHPVAGANKGGGQVNSQVPESDQTDRFGIARPYQLWLVCADGKEGSQESTHP